jgi:two-component system LytT family response regulator
MKAIIIEDEVNCSRTLEMLLHKYVKDVEVLACCKDGKEGLDSIHLLKPDLVFLDIEMPHMTGLEMLEKLDKIDFHLVFTTSYNQYALKAFRYSAIDYLLKPVSTEELLQAMDKVRKYTTTAIQQVDHLLKQLQQKQSVSKIALPTMEGFQMILIENIISCEADDNYTILHLRDGKTMVVTYTLGDAEDILKDLSFLRVHRGHVVNLNEIERYVKGEGGYLVMSDGSSIDVSRSRKEGLLKRLLPHKS